MQNIDMWLTKFITQLIQSKKNPTWISHSILDLSVQNRLITRRDLWTEIICLEIKFIAKQILPLEDNEFYDEVLGLINSRIDKQVFR